MTDIQILKQSLRREVRARLKTMSPELQRRDSARACEVFLAQEAYRRAKTLLLYVPLPGEADVRWVMDRAVRDGKAVALPRFVPETGAYGAFLVGDEPLAPGPFGVLEPGAGRPVAVNRLDLIMAPGLGFDARGRRLGRGKGFYDRLLSGAAGLKCGLCFEEQLLAEIPAEPHDVGVHCLATPSRWLDCRGAAPEM
jgi:5-formyltetrahydrofolate cyclo-ligase